MNAEELALAGVKLLSPTLHNDPRGHFAELFTLDELEQQGIPTQFAQANVSHSLPGVLRGLHYQIDPPQGKLVSCVAGRIFDVVADITVSSPTFGHHVAIELDAVRRQLLWVPPGYAHGLAVLGDEPATVIYYVSSRYNPASEAGVPWDDPALAIQWPTNKPLLSDRDRRHTRISGTG
jgi:dTDP-4-dehydrorhamnose 3,5-epimerase